LSVGRTSALWEYLEPPSAFGDPDRTGVSAAGVRVTMQSGRTLLCGTSGLWNVNFGYGQPAIAEAVRDQLLDASYFGLFRSGSRIAAQAADALLEVCGRDVFARVLFATSGSAANDLVMKLSRQAARLQGDRARNLVVGLRGSYHGQTYGALSLSGEELLQDEFAVDRRYVRHVDPFDGGRELSDLCERDGDRIAVLVLEPVLGSGALVVPDTFVQLAGELADKHGFLLAADEVATGYHRTGPFRASSTWSRQPDLLVLSKGLTNGTCAASAVVASLRACAPFDMHDFPLVHGETQAGTPASCAAMLATLDIAREFEHQERAKNVAVDLDTALAALQARSRLTVSLTGAGAFRGVQVAAGPDPVSAQMVSELVSATREQGAIVQPGLHGVQLVPALCYTTDEVAELVGCLEAGLDAFAGRL